MSFLKPLMDAAPALGVNSAATGLGHAIGVDPNRIAQIANSIGKASNGIANAGGAAPGYSAPEIMNNHMQMLDPRILQALGASFNPRMNTVDFQ